MNKLYSRILALLVALGTVAACHEPPPPLTPDKIAELVKGQPHILVNKDGKVTLEGLEEVYLGMSEEEALAALKPRCKRFVELTGGVMRESSVFKGCLTPDDPQTYAIRVGLTKRASNRVFTLEVERRPVSLQVIRARFVEMFPNPRLDLPKRGALTMESGIYNLFADIDEGVDGPTHILIGLSDAGVEALNNESK